MQTATTGRAVKPDVIHQLTIFGDCEEIPINPPTQKKDQTPTTKAERPAPKIQTIQPAQRKSASTSPTPAADVEILLPGERVDDGIIVDLEAEAASDAPEMIMAKRMFLRMLWDITPKLEPVAAADLFGQASNTTQSEQDKLDALVWLYGLNPAGSRVSFEWVCEVLDFNPERVRRIVGRSTREELKRLVNLLSTIVSEEHAAKCVETLSEYVNVENWQTK